MTENKSALYAVVALGGMEANTFNEWNFLQVVRNMPVDRMKTLKLVI